MIAGTDTFASTSNHNSPPRVIPINAPGYSIYIGKTAPLFSKGWNSGTNADALAARSRKQVVRTRIMMRAFSANLYLCYKSRADPSSAMPPGLMCKNKNDSSVFNFIQLED
jgi:hypothetical protein